MKATQGRSQVLPATTIARNDSTPSIRPEALSQKIAALNELTAQQLRDEWRCLYRAQPPRLSRDLLIRTVAYRLQELAFDGLSKATLRKLAVLTKQLTGSGSIEVARDSRLRPGARLVREWRGRAHTVVVSDDGYEYAGKSYSSLTTIAQIITGAHWSGPRFFGLNHAGGIKTSFDDSSGAYQAGEDVHE
jgi:hypothetical protein